MSASPLGVVGCVQVRRWPFWWLLDVPRWLFVVVLERNGLSSEGLDEYLHTATKTEDEMKSRFFLDVVVGEGTTILELLSSEDETLLIRGDAFFVLNLGLHIVDRVGGLDFQGDRLAREGLNKDLHTSTEAKDEVKWLLSSLWSC